jgi:hypothetical protein
LTGNYVTKFNGQFTNRPTVNGTGILLSGEAANLPATIVYITGNQTISGTKIFEDYLNINTTNVSNFRLNIGGDKDENAGMQVDSYGINPPQILMRRARGTPTALSGVLKDDVLFNLQARGYVSGLNDYSTNSRAAIRLIASEDWVATGGYNGQGTHILFRSTNIGNSTAIDKALINSSGLNVIDGNIYVSGKQVLTGVDLSSYYPRSNPSGYISDASLNNVVYTTGDQTISGFKTFASRPTVNGTGVLLIGEASNVTLPNTVVYTTGNQMISGTKTFLNNINVSGTGIFNALDLNNIDIISLSGVDISITNGNVALTNRPTVNGTGVLLIGEAAELPNTIVYITGNQNISENKTFINNLEVQGTGIFNALDLSNIGQFDFSGVNINLINGNVNISGGTLYISEKPVLTGVDLSSYITTGQTGVFYPRNNPSGFITGVDLSNYVTKSNGQFTNLPSVNGTGILLSGQEIFEKRHDFVTGNLYDYSYCGTAFKNSSINENVWAIRRLSINSAGATIFNQSVTNYSWTGRYLAPYN